MNNTPDQIFKLMCQQDPYRVEAARMFRTTPELVTPQQRQLAKMRKHVENYSAASRLIYKSSLDKE